jgi:hypothetical protein
MSSPSLTEEKKQYTGAAYQQAQNHKDDCASGKHPPPEHSEYRPKSVSPHGAGCQWFHLPENVRDVVAFTGRGRREIGSRCYFRNFGGFLSYLKIFWNIHGTSTIWTGTPEHARQGFNRTAARGTGKSHGAHNRWRINEKHQRGKA